MVIRSIISCIVFAFIHHESPIASCSLVLEHQARISKVIVCLNWDQSLDHYRQV